MSNLSSTIRSTGHYLPEKILTNHDLEKMVETSNDWIVQRTGIKERRIAADNETTGDMAIAAAREALENASLSGQDIDAIIVATTTPDRTFPSVAVKVQDALNIPNCPAFDVQAVCSGFMYALATGDSFIKNGLAKRALIIGAEKMSSIVDWTDRGTCVLFADGAGAIVLEDTKNTNSGILSNHLYANGRMQDMLFTDGGPATNGQAGKIHMHGREVFKNAVQCMSDVVEEAMQKNNVSGDDVDWLVPHQANIRIIEATAKKLGMSMDKVVVTVDRHGNTSAASVPLALHTGVSDGRIQRGDLILLEAMGAGFTWASSLIRF